jgi:hypothetical protein
MDSYFSGVRHYLWHEVNLEKLSGVRWQQDNDAHTKSMKKLHRELLYCLWGFHHTSNMCLLFTQFDISIWLLFIAIKSSQVPRKDHLSTLSFFPTLVKTLKSCLLL